MNMKRSIAILILAALLGAWGCVAYPRQDYRRGGYYDRYDDYRYYDYDYRGRYRDDRHRYGH